MFSENKNKEEHTQTMAGGREKSRKQAKYVFKMRERYLTNFKKALDKRKVYGIIYW